MDESCEVALYNMIAEDYWGFGTGHRKTQKMVRLDTIIHNYYIIVYYI